MMFFIWMGLAFFAGLALYLVTPWTAAKIAGEDWVEYVSGLYVWLAQTAVTKSAIVERDGTLELVSKRFDSEIHGDKDKEHGDPRHHRDGLSVLSRLKNKSFGVALHDRAEYVSPLLAELGESAWRAREANELGSYTTGEGIDRMRDGITVPRASRLVDLSRARHLTTGDADPEDGHESYLRTKISQEQFNEKLSFGQSLMIVLGFIGSAVAMFYLTSQTGGAGTASSAPAPSPTTNTTNATNTTTVSVLFLLSTLGLSDIDFDDLARKLGAVAWIIGWVVTWPLTALLMDGLMTAMLVLVVMTGVAMAVPAGIALAGPSIPKSIGLILARGHWILAQLSVGRGMLVRRETGEYEHHKLYHADSDADHDFEVLLNDGTTLPVNGSEGDLYRFGWAPLGITEEKGESNMGPITQDTSELPTLSADGGRIGPDNKRQGHQPAIKIPQGDNWLVTLPQLWSWCQGSSESKTIEQGRDKALSEHGGAQQIGGLVFTIAVLASTVIGGAFGFLAGGGL